MNPMMNVEKVESLTTECVALFARTSGGGCSLAFLGRVIDVLHGLPGVMHDAQRYRFLRSPLAAEAGPVQRELWEEMGVKLCREEAMDREVDTAMCLLHFEETTTRSPSNAESPR